MDDKEWLHSLEIIREIENKNIIIKTATYIDLIEATRYHKYNAYSLIAENVRFNFGKRI